MTRFQHSIFYIIFAGLLSFLSFSRADAGHTAAEYSKLFDYIALDDLEAPLVAFGIEEKAVDRRLNQENIAYLNTNAPLLDRIQSELPGDKLQWELDNAYKRLLLVPERRLAYATLFERYCRDAVDFLLKQIDMPDPYGRITTFRGAETARAETSGVTVYLVHNVINEYIEEYHFFNPDDGHSGIRIQLSNRVFSGIIGSYTSNLKIGEGAQLEFVREPYTIWQNSAEQPLNVFIVPVEETLHILLRPATEKAMARQIKLLPVMTRKAIKDIVDAWMSTEEALVGGLVHHIMPALLAHLINDASESELDATIAARQDHSQYRYLGQGIHLVADLGPAEAMARYRDNPELFRKKLEHIPNSVTAALDNPAMTPPN